MAALFTACAAEPEEADFDPDGSPPTSDPSLVDFPDVGLTDLILPPQSDCDPRGIGASATYAIPSGATALWPRLSPGASRLVVQIHVPGAAARLDVIDVCTGATATLVNGVDDQAGAVWSPDGKELYFALTDGGLDGGGIFAAATAGGKPRPILGVLGAMELDVSADSSTLSFVDSLHSGQVFAYDFGMGDEPRSLGITGNAPRLRADGKALLFAGRADHEPTLPAAVSELDLISGTVTEISSITPSPAFGSLDYFPDGSIAVSSSTGVHHLYRDGTMARLSPKAGMIDVSDDGRFLAIAEEERLLVLQLIDGVTP